MLSVCFSADSGKKYFPSFSLMPAPKFLSFFPGLYVLVVAMCTFVYYTQCFLKNVFKFWQCISSYKTQLGIMSYFYGETSLGWGFFNVFFLFYKLCGKLGTVQNGTNPENFTEA